MLFRVLIWLFIRLPLIRKGSHPAQPALGWAFVFWGGVLLASGIAAILEGSRESAWVVAAVILLAPAATSVRKRCALGMVAGLLVWTGPLASIFALPIAFAIVGLGRHAVFSSLLLAGCALLSPHAQSLPLQSGFTLPPSSLCFVLMPSWGSCIVFWKELTSRDRLTLALLPVALAAILDASAGHWIGPRIFTDSICRLLAALMPMLAIAQHRPAITFSPIAVPKSFVLGLFISGITVAIGLPTVPITRMVFDESHGKWETVQAAFGPTDFGRSANYTYSLLFERAKRITGDAAIFEREDQALPDANSVFMLKMPTIPLSEAFSIRLAEWVRTGGRLIVVADHTDLYDSAQNLNSFLGKHLGALINSDAVPLTA